MNLLSKNDDVVQCREVVVSREDDVFYENENSSSSVKMIQNPGERFCKIPALNTKKSAEKRSHRLMDCWDSVRILLYYHTKFEGRSRKLLFNSLRSRMMGTFHDGGQADRLETSNCNSFVLHASTVSQLLIIVSCRCY